MNCPDCATKITAKHFDAEFQWYECPKCEGCFTADEMEEARGGRTVRGSERNGSGGRSAASVVAHAATKKVAVKGKKRQTEIADDDEAIAKFEAETLKPVKTDDPPLKKHRDEVSTKEVVNTWAAEIQDVYEELGGRLDDENARDKALILWRQVQTETGVSAREQDVGYATCNAHG